MTDDEAIIAPMRAWVEKVVVGLNFCPFAAGALRDGQLRYAASHARDTEGVLQDLIAECRHLDEHPDTETTLLLLPRGFADFDAFLDLVALADDLLAMQGYEGIYQLAHFHPRYRFADAPPDDPADYTNRAPVPALHILREASLEKAVLNHPDPEGIPERNMRFARDKGIDFMQALLDECRKTSSGRKS